MYILVAYQNIKTNRIELPQGNALLLIMRTIFTIFFCFLQTQVLAGGNCPPPGFDRQQLLQLKDDGFVLTDDTMRTDLAVALVGCVGDPDPLIRDGVAFEALSGWMRGKQLAQDTIMTVYEDLLKQVSSDVDPNGFQQPFAILILSEVARTDRVEAWFTSAMREQMVETAVGYLSGVRDYRGFSDTEGWRHGVAHGSDLVLQLVLNENINEAQIRRLMTAVAGQVAPAVDMSYGFGEPGRLARAVVYAYRRGVSEDAEWTVWFDSISDPAPLENWSDSYSSQAGLAKRHNTLAFLTVLHLNAMAADNEQGLALAALVMQAIGRVLRG